MTTETSSERPHRAQYKDGFQPRDDFQKEHFEPNLLLIPYEGQQEMVRPLMWMIDSDATTAPRIGANGFRRPAPPHRPGAYHG